MYNDLKSLKIELYHLKDEECLKFIFKDKFKGKDAERSVVEWRDLFASLKGERIPLIWDCLEMTGYETKARTTWQQAMKELKNQIDCVWLVTNSKIIKAGAKLMSAFTKFTIKVVKSENEIVLT